jgi:hypothetical protein
MRNRVALPVVVVAAFSGLLAISALRRGPGYTPMLPAPDLRCVAFPTAGVTVAEHGSGKLEIVTDEWMVYVRAVKPEKLGNIMSALQGVVARSADCRADVLEGQPGAPTIHRFLRGVQGPHRAVQADYLISFDGAWASARASSRVPAECFDVTPIEQFLLAFRLADRPVPECEVPPAWRTYQARRRPGSPIAKFVIYMDPAPVCLGNYQTGLVHKTRFTPADFRRGGRQITPDLIEFYTTDDEPQIRIDFWLGSQPEVKGREPVFDAKLRVEARSFSVWSFFEPYEVPIPSGEYDVSITRLNRGSHIKRALTDAERFDRDDLERYEVLVRRRPTD